MFGPGFSGLEKHPVPACPSLLSPNILSSQDGPVLGAVGSFSWSGGAFLYPPNTRPTFINMSQENVDMRDSYLGKRRLWEGKGGLSCLKAGEALVLRSGTPQVTPPQWPFGRGFTA